MNPKYIRIKQHDLNDCGPACLAAILAYWQHPIPVSRIRMLTGTNTIGTSLYALQQVAKQLGFHARGAQCKMELIQTLPVPSIVHVNIHNQHHYWVVYNCLEQQVTYMDPADGQLHQITLETFKTFWTGKLLWFEQPKQPCRITAITNLQRLIRFVLPLRKFLLLLFFTGVLATFAGLAISLFLQVLLDVVLPSGDTGLLAKTSIALLCVFVLHVLLQGFRSLLTIKMGQLLDRRMLNYYYEKVFQLPLPAFQSFQIGDLMSRMHDATKIRTFIQTFSLDVIVNILVLLCSMAIMFAVSFKLALFLTTTIPLFALLLYVSNKFHQKWNLKMMQQAAQVESNVIEQLQHFSAIKYLALEKRTIRKIEVVLNRFLETTTKFGNRQVGLNALTELFTKLVTVVLLWQGANLVINDQLTPGELIFFFVVSGYFIGAVLFFAGLPSSYQDARLAVDRLFDVTNIEDYNLESPTLLLDRDVQIQQLPQIAPVDYGRQEVVNVKSIRLQNVHFAYVWGKPVLEGLSIALPLGQLSVIIGDNGSGKSTLLAIIAGMYRPQQGTVTIEAQQLTSTTESNQTLGKTVGFVPKEVTVFSGTIVENIVLFETAPDTIKLNFIIDLFQLKEKLSHCPEGLLQVLSGMNNTLSGGQQQLIALARAFYIEPSILLLDEPTAHADTATIHIIIAALEWYKNQGNTLIVVTHDPRIEEIADNCYNLHNGNIEALNF